MYRDQRLATYYAPFDFVNRSARLALVGVTPGPTQMLESFESARDDLNAGKSQSEALERVKLRASFKGMRRDLGRWLDELGLAAALGLPSCSAVFEPENLQMLHTTSAIRYPTFRRNREGDWVNYSGVSPTPADHPFLAAVVREVLLPELQGLSTAIIVPLGKANAVVEALCDEGVLPRDRCIVGMPHPSPASPHRERYFQQAKSHLRSQAARVGQPVQGARRTPMKPQRDRQGKDRPRDRSTGQRRSPIGDPIVPDRAIHIQLTQGNINNNHVYLREHLGFFPPDAIGGPARTDGEARC